MVRTWFSHHAGVVVGLLGGVNGVELGLISRQSLGAVYQHLLQTSKVLLTKKRFKLKLQYQSSDLIIITSWAHLKSCADLAMVEVCESEDVNSVTGKTAQLSAELPEIMMQLLYVYWK